MTNKNKLIEPSIPNYSRSPLTYSSLATFRNCRRKFYWRNERELVPIGADTEVLFFGELFHQMLAEWHISTSLAPTERLHHVLATLARLLPSETREAEPKQEWIYRKLAAMLGAYSATYVAERFAVEMIEQEFHAEIRSPQTGAPSRSFTMAGKVDGLIRQPNGELWLLEHKTASESSLDAAYIEKLWTDFQITLYSSVLSRLLGEPIHGVLYNVICKPTLRPSDGKPEESEDAYQARLAELAAKNKSGKSNAKKHEAIPAETGEEYERRCLEWLLDTSEGRTRLLRIPLYIGAKAQQAIEAEVWDLTQQLLIARRENAFYQNTSQCYAYGRACPYFQICASGDNPLVIENQYIHERAHSELSLGLHE